MPHMTPARIAQIDQAHAQDTERLRKLITITRRCPMGIDQSEALIAAHVYDAIDHIRRDTALRLLAVAITKLARGGT